MNPADHVCKEGCRCCHAQTACVKTKWVQCSECRRRFVSEACYQNHIATGLCKNIQACADCGKQYHTYREHVCGMVYCKLCKEHQPEDHLCFMKPLSSNDDREDDEEDEDPRPAKRRKKMKVQRFIFYDFECMLVDKQHVPNLCVIDSVCEHCMQTPMDAQCYYCKHEQVVFSGPDTLQQVGEWMFSGKNKGAICIAHNSQVCICFKNVLYNVVCMIENLRYCVAGL